MKNIIFVLFLFMTASQSMAFVMGYDKNAKIELFVGGRSSGHEEISRQAMILTRDELAKIGILPQLGNEEIFGDLDPDIFGKKGSTSPNMIIQGNYATDFPEPAEGMRYPINLITYWKYPNKVTQWNRPEDVDWHNNPEGQALHGLRNYVNGQLQTPLETCQETRASISQVTKDAIRFWQANLRTQGAFLLGHATHILQDTFSPAHTARTIRLQGNILSDICYYGTEQKKNLLRVDPRSKVCYHEKIDPRDGIYVASDASFFQTKGEWYEFGYEVERVYNAWMGGFAFSEKNKQNGIKHESRLAKVATARYLYIVAKYVRDARIKNLVTEQGTFHEDRNFEILEDRLQKGLYDGTDEEIRNPMMRKTLPIGALNCKLLEGKP